MELIKAVKLLIISFLILASLVICHSDIYAGNNDPLLDPFPSLRHGVGARSLAMGGTGVVNSFGAEAVLWNPAGIITNRKLCVEVYGNQTKNSSEFTGIPSNQYMYAGAVFQLTKKKWLVFDKPTIGAAIFYFGISDLSVIGVNPVSAHPLVTDHNSESYSDVLLIVPLATDVIYSENKLSIGINLLAHYHSMFSFSSDIAYGFDLGARWNILGDPVSFMPKTEDVLLSPYFIQLGTRFRHIDGIPWSSSGALESYTQNGWSYTDIGIVLGARRPLSMEFLDAVSVSTQIRLDENDEYRTSFGGELAFGSFRARAGVSNIISTYSSSSYKVANSSMSFGIGLVNVPKMNFLSNMHLNYCYRMYFNNVNTWMDSENSLAFGYSF